VLISSPASIVHLLYQAAPLVGGTKTKHIMSQPSTPSQLPNEIWLEILKLATLDNRCTVSHYIPFQLRASNENDGAVLGIKRNLSLVCRQWRQMIIELLYRNIRIAHGAKGLREVLRTKTADGSSIYGDWASQHFVMQLLADMASITDLGATSRRTLFQYNHRSI